MYNAITKEQLASLLSTSHQDVDILWQRGVLQRTEPREDLGGLQMHTSSYDLLEYMLWAGKLDVLLSKEHAALWVTNFAEIMEMDSVLNLTSAEMRDALFEYSIEDELCSATHENWQIASCIIESHEIIVAFCTAHRTLCELMAYVDHGTVGSRASTVRTASIVNDCRTADGVIWS